MTPSEKIEAYYEKEHPFKEGIAILRSLARQTEAAESYKWNFPVYTIENKNVLGICKFKNHFGVWFFNGSLLKDPKKVLQNAQEGKTKGMRHWKFSSLSEIDREGVLSYMKEALENQKNGLVIKPEKKKTEIDIPELLQNSLNAKPSLRKAYLEFSNYKQKEFCEYIGEAKQEATKQKRLEKVLPMIEQGIGLNDKYR
ncbi:YdeI/OmpD-associated family protein [Flagellimonas sp.]|uniref:YdeI/OmpD-associated family protein n=1 Tax=Flagellimonas sp. TaxID=2058762 RepID=UPI003F4A1E53